MLFYLVSSSFLVWCLYSKGSIFNKLNGLSLYSIFTIVMLFAQMQT